MNTPADYYDHKIKVAHALRVAIAAIEHLQKIDFQYTHTYDEILKIFNSRLEQAEYVS